jgi:hypothetical protein
MASDLPSTPLPGLPGAAHAGTGPVVDPLLDDLLSDSAPRQIDDADADAVVRALDAHRDHRLAWYGDLIGPLRVPASATLTLLAALRSSDDSMPILLMPDLDSDDLLGELRAARSLLLDNHRVELTGIELPFAVAGSAADAARLALEALDFTVPAWFMVAAEPGWEPAFDVLAKDGAESVALQLPLPTSSATGDGSVFDGVAVAIRALIDRELPYSVIDGVGGLVTSDEGHGVLNLLGATRAALNGAGVEELSAILTERDLAPLAAAARRMSEADAATVRAFLTTVSAPSIRDLIDDLAAEDLIEPDAA